MLDSPVTLALVVGVTCLVAGYAIKAFIASHGSTTRTEVAKLATELIKSRPPASELLLHVQQQIEAEELALKHLVEAAMPGMTVTKVASVPAPVLHQSV